jgi:hypothetical protein
MVSPKLDWNQIVSGKRPKGSGDLGASQKLAWKWLRCVEAAIDNALSVDDMETFSKLVHAGGMLLARHQALCQDSELSAKLDDLIAKRQNGTAPRAYTFGHKG